MEHSNWDLDGAYDFPLRVHKQDNGSYRATCDYVPEKHWDAADEVGAIKAANEELRVMRQSHQLVKAPEWAGDFGAKPWK